jgi:hypothetical protein
MQNASSGGEWPRQTTAGRQRSNDGRYALMALISTACSLSRPSRCGREQENERSTVGRGSLHTLNMFGPFFSPISHPELHPGFELSTVKSTTIFLLRLFLNYFTRGTLLMEIWNENNLLGFYWLTNNKRAIWTIDFQVICQ